MFKLVGGPQLQSCANEMLKEKTVSMKNNAKMLKFAVEMLRCVEVFIRNSNFVDE